MPLVDPIELLARPDKWYLGNGGMLLYAPPFPKYLRVPGFWDDCQFGDLRLERLLCVSFAASLDGTLTELKPRLDSWQWYPDRIEIGHRLGVSGGVAAWQDLGVRLSETRRLGPDGTLHCELELEQAPDADGAPDELHIVAWTARDTKSEEPAEGFAEVERFGRALTYRQDTNWRSHGRGAEPLKLSILMSGDTPPDSLQITPSHSARLVPELRSTPLWDSLRNGHLSNEIVGDNVLGSVVYAGLHWRAKLGGEYPYRLVCRVSARNPAAGSRPRPDAGVHTGGSSVDPTIAWREFISLVPHFECSDELLTRYYWYRWYGLRLNALPPGGMYVAPGVAEGLGYFRGVITYSLMCHLFECKWLSDPVLARGCLRNHLAYQTRSGHLPGHVYISHVNTAGFYHTDIGHGVGDLLSHHPDDAFLLEVTAPLTRLLMYYLRERDKEGLDLYDVWDQYETGQEFTSRYFHAHPRADQFDWEHQIKLKGVDVTVYVYHLTRLLQRIGEYTGDARAVRHHAELAERIKVGVRSFCWDEDKQFFFDYNAHRKEISPYWSSVGFYPLLSTLAKPEQAKACARHLDDERKFAAPWPHPTVARDDEHFSAEPRWRGERANCPWNGRVWPMTNSHLVEVYGRLAEQWPEEYRPKLAAFLRRYIEMLHYERAGGGKDPARPNCFEHYSPQDGSACEYRGVDDYMHSWVADHILRWVAGVRLLVNELTVDPLPFGLDYFLLTNCKVAGRALDVCYNVDREGGPEPGYRVYLDGEIVRRTDKPTPWHTVL